MTSFRSIFHGSRQPEKEKGSRAEGGLPEGEDHMLNMLKATPNGKGQGSAPHLFSEAQPSDARRAKAWLADRIAAAAKLPENELLAETITVTPALAEIVLADHNKGNRSIRPKRVAIWEKAILEGRWRLTSQGISFARDGRLNNGQHRLTAIAQTGRSVRMHVAFNEERAVFDVLDTGAGRGGADVLHIAGYKNTAMLAAAARLLRSISLGRPGANDIYPNELIRETVEAHPRLEMSTTAGHTIASKFKSSGAAATVAFYLINERSPNARRFDTFLDALKSGAGLAARDPVLILRDGLQTKTIDSGVRGASQRTTQQCAATIKAWNAWLRGKKASAASLRWTATREPFPMPE